METWRAIRKDGEVKVYFPALNPNSALKGESLWLKVVDPGSGASPESEFVGEVTEEPAVDVGVTKGLKIRMPAWRVDEVR